MQRLSIAKDRVSDRLGYVAVAAFLILVFLATGCDVPGSDARTRRAAERAQSRVEHTPPQVASAALVTEEAPVVEPEPALPEHVTYEEARTVFDNREYLHAADLFTVYAEDRPENPWGYYMIGLSAWRAGDTGRAEDAYRLALERDPTHLKTLLNLSRLLLATGRPGEAEDRAKDALSVDPASADGFRLLGLARADLGRTEEAIEAFRQAVILDEHDAWAMNNLGLVHIRRGAYFDALPPLARATELRPDEAVFQNNLGLALERTGYNSAAVEAFRAALVADPGHTRAQVSLARVEGRPDDALGDPIDLVTLGDWFLQDIRGEPETVAEEVALGLVAPAIAVIETEPNTVSSDSAVVSDSPVVPVTTVVPDSAVARDSTVTPDSTQTHDSLVVLLREDSRNRQR